MQKQKTRVSKNYRLPFGAPLQWQDEATGELSTAIKAYLHYQPLNSKQITLISDYLRYYIAAPCWKREGMEAKFEDLEARTKLLRNEQQIKAWLKNCSELGLYPLQ